MAWRAIVHSAIGTRHLQKQLPCQDYGNYLMQADTLIGVVSDGAGSAKFSDIGSKLAVKTALAMLEEREEHWSSVDLETINADAQILFTEMVEAVVTALRSQAESGEYPLRELGCTLLGFIATPNWLACMQIGDGFIVTQAQQTAPNLSETEPIPSFDLLFEPVKGEYINETVFVTSDNAVEHMQIAVRADHHPFVCAATDGLEKVAIRFQDWQAFPPFFKPFFECLRSISDPEERQTYVETFLESDRLNAKTDDDKTLLLCLFRPEDDG
ncbi:protein phosphatase 2C domain-containing protein [Acaryochloris sp. 'Moss Beach']|uniref:PP2C family serine/threonine-protein phosphatase n=1 Tax=Acaryochloris sp. 'Moss Beach' TaxID=2740837 RepID=UPI001F3696F3|nr:PP2C family serine/threonine-protein phosphatase [Acaryochloris sp. 'Moss Beach']UJB71307.1 protein phosphatase 2C domain-containing protein [Acaryochloris sp. 'Moss Beach']